MADPRIPVTVLTGFLGAGKTTLLNHWLTSTPPPRLAVLENELSDLPLDTDLLVRVDEDLVETATGCLCCAARGDLPAGLMRLWPHRARFTRVVIETTGLAEPGPVLLTLLADPQLAPRFVLDGVVTVLDAVHAAAQLAARPEARAQVALADRLVINKTDLARGGAVSALEDRLTELNAHTETLHAVRGIVPIAALAGLRPTVDASGERLPEVAARLPLFASFRPLGAGADDAPPRLWWGAWDLPADPAARLELDAPTIAGPATAPLVAPLGHHVQDVVDLDRLRLVLLPLADTAPATIERATVTAQALLASPDPEEEPLGPGRRLSPNQAMRLRAGQGGHWTLAVPAASRYGLFGPRDAGHYHGLRVTIGDGTLLPAVATASDASSRTHSSDLAAIGFTLPGFVDAELFEGWFGAVLATRAADLPRAKGVLNIAGSSRRWVFQSVHALADTLPGPAWRDGELRQNRLVFIGRNLDEALLREGFAECLRSGR